MKPRRLISTPRSLERLAFAARDPGGCSPENPAALGPGWRLAAAAFGRAEEGEEEGDVERRGVKGVGGVIYAEQALLPLPLTLPTRCSEPEGARGAS